jgi:hypothetical protein
MLLLLLLLLMAAHLRIEILVAAVSGPVHVFLSNREEAQRNVHALVTESLPST